tara:strand:- start:35378 stop:37306 length:1929 start_codon:yes stop_codon:yes gene_type:complete
MCGIAGIFDYHANRYINLDLLTYMNNALTHRGPDDSGFFTQPGIGLAHRRLSIIDLESGRQPITNEDESLVIIFNGEIYNFPILKKLLIGKGYKFKTETDTEVILHAYHLWGEECVHHLQGMFAFAIWDKMNNSVFIARDRLGIKPLYYAYLKNGEFIFASELKSLIIHPEFENLLCPNAIDEYFAFGYVPEPKTIYRNVFKLPPGHFLTVKWGHQPRLPQRYWDVEFDPVERTEQQALDQCLENLDSAVQSHLISDVPLGAFLSGGVDSSAVVSSMAKVNSNVKTCSVAFSEKSFNEAEYALKVAEHLKTNHSDFRVEPVDIDILDSLFDLYGEPFADSSAIPTYRVCQLARQQVKVALSGDGGDETIAGYRRYRGHIREEYFRNMLPSFIRTPIFNLLASSYPKLDWAPRFLRAKSTFQAMARDTVNGYFNSIALFKDHYRSRLFSHDFLNKIKGTHPIHIFEHHMNNYSGPPGLSFVQYLDLKTYLPGDILTKVDRASMAHSLEVRVPLLDAQWVEWAATLTDDMKLKGQEGKYIFKKATAQRVPSEVIYRRKQGFAVPLNKWFKGALKQRMINLKSSPTLQQSGIFNPKLISKLVDQHLASTHDHSAMIWSLLVFENFYKKHIDIRRNYHVTQSIASL